MELHLSMSGARGLEREVYQRLKAAVLGRRLRGGERLPPTRELAKDLGVARNTVIHAYEQLIAEGFLEARVGAGTFVCAEVGVHRRAPTDSPILPRAFFRTRSAEPASAPRASHDFQVGVPDPALFPWDVWRPLVARQLQQRRWRPGYPSPEGDPRARAAIAHQVGLSRSVQAGPEDVLVTSGAQQALQVIAHALLEPGDVVAMEDPGYARARTLFASLGARVVPVRVDAEGLDVAALPHDARLVYVTPSHQFPLGMPMSLARRLALLEWSARRKAALIEDDYDSEFRFDGRPLEPLQSLDRAGRVIYVGSFSKVLLPTLRLGFLIAPQALMPALREAKGLADAHSPLESQRALAALLEEGLFGRHVRRVQRVYAERRGRLIEAIDREFGDEVLQVPSRAGLHHSLHFVDERVDLAAVVARAAEAGVGVQPLTPYYQRHPRAGLALGYGVIEAARIAEGLRLLARSFRAVQRPGRQRAPRAGAGDEALHAPPAK